MVRVKKNRQPAKAQPKKKTRPRPPRNRVPQDLAASPYALARLDPWNPGARGAKVPDFDNNASCASEFTFEFNSATDANGRTCTIFPLWPSCVAKNTAWNAGAGVYFGNGSNFPLGQSGAFFSGWDECVGLRVVGAGIKFRCPLNTNNAQGKAVFIPMSIAEMRGWSGAAGAGQGLGESDFAVRKGAEKMELSDMANGHDKWFVMSTLDPTSNMYIEPNLDMIGAAMDATDFPNYVGCVVAVMGAPASTVVLEATVTLHYEWLPGKTYNFMATRAEPTRLGVLEKVNNIAEATPRFMDGVSSIAGNVFKAVTTGLKIAGTIGLL